MTAPSNTDDVVEQILSTYDAITVVGASANPSKAANEVPAYMKNRGWRIIPVNPAADEIVVIGRGETRQVQEIGQDDIAILAAAFQIVLMVARGGMLVILAGVVAVSSG